MPGTTRVATEERIGRAMPVVANLFTVLFASIFVFLVVFAVVSDVRKLIIPNWVSIALVVEFLLYGLVFLDLSDVLRHSAVSLVVFAIGLGFVF